MTIKLDNSNRIIGYKIYDDNVTKQSYFLRLGDFIKKVNNKNCDFIGVTSAGIDCNNNIIFLSGYTVETGLFIKNIL